MGPPAVRCGKKKRDEIELTQFNGGRADVETGYPVEVKNSKNARPHGESGQIPATVLRLCGGRGNDVVFLLLLSLLTSISFVFVFAFVLEQGGGGGGEVSAWLSNKVSNEEGRLLPHTKTRRLTFLASLTGQGNFLGGESQTKACSKAC